jgi:hypothetical protein
MSSSKSQGDRDPVPLRLSPDQFEVLFQIAKEFRSLPESRLTAIDVESEDVDRLLELVRSIRRRIKETSQIQLNVTFDEVNTPPSPVEIVGSAESQPSATIFEAVADRLLAAWDRLSEATIVSLGPRELFLRTGYDEAEIRQVTVHLTRSGPPTTGGGMGVPT